MTLKIGPLAVDPPVVLAPMAGVTNPVFRTLCREYGAALYVSEMVSAVGVVHRDAGTLRLLRFGADEAVRSVQLYGSDPSTLGDAVRIVVAEYGVGHVDINVGCPMAKITRRGGGSALPVRRVLFRNLVRAAVRAAGAVPVTVKMRKGLDEALLTYLEAGVTAQDEGAAAVTLHARTAEQLYSGRADWAAIGELKVALDVPVLGNGDIWCADDALAMQAATGCDGVVIGRGCLGRPWLFGDLADAYAGRPVAPAPLLGDVTVAMSRHARLLVEQGGDELAALREFRKHTGWYLTGYPVGESARRRLTGVGSLTELDEVLDGFPRDTPPVPGGERLPRGHLAGPRRVTLPDRWLADRDDPTPPGRGAEIAPGG